MASGAKKLNLYLRFDEGEFDGLGHGARSIELAKELKKKFNVILCTNKISKNLTHRKKFKIFFKHKNEKEENFLLRISYNHKNSNLFIDKNYNYSKNFLRILSKRFNKVFFYQNFSKGIQKQNIIINPTPDLNSSVNLKKKFNQNKIYNGNKYFIIPKSRYTKKGNYLGISFGGSDPKNISIKVLKFLIKMNWKISTYLFLGTFFKFEKKINKLNLPKNIKIRKFDKIKFHGSRLAVCSPGVTAFELLSKKVYALHISHSKKHDNLGKYIEKKYKFSKNLNVFNKVKLNDFNNILNYYWNNKKIITNEVSKNKLNMFDNSCKKVVDVIINETKKK